MPDLPNDFWSGWIVVLTSVSFIALVWIVFSVYFFSTEENKKDASSKEPVWDEDLREGVNPPPLWWFWLIFSAMILTVIYLILYPGMGSYRGVLNWSQDSRLASSYDTYHQKFKEKRIAIAQSSIPGLQNDPVLMETAERIFSQNCAVCHGYDGRGQAAHFPNLKDSDWQWGGSPEQIEQSIRKGRTATMISWQAILGDEGVGQVTEYVMNINQENRTESPGHVSYQQYCMACHGPEGQGNILLGAPNLQDDIWLYGGSADEIRKSISVGRNGIMPAFDKRLDDAQIKMLAAWLAR